MLRFKDVQFMSATDKGRVHKDWQKFLVPLACDDPRNRIFDAFTNRLYHHLTQHCSFIAHYNKFGFYEVYFTDPEDTPKVLQQFDSEKGNLSYEYGSVSWLDGDYADINQAMCREFEGCKLSIYRALRQRVRRKKREAFERAKQDLIDIGEDIM